MKPTSLYKISRGFDALVFHTVLNEFQTIINENKLDVKDFDVLESYYYFHFFAHRSLYRILNDIGEDKDFRDILLSNMKHEFEKSVDDCIRTSGDINAKNRSDERFKEYSNYSNEKHHDIKSLTDAGTVNIHIPSTKGSIDEKANFAVAMGGLATIRKVESLLKSDVKTISRVKRILAFNGFIKKHDGYLMIALKGYIWLGLGGYFVIRFLLDNESFALFWHHFWLIAMGLVFGWIWVRER